MKREVVVVGGGISGLACAERVARDASVSVTLVEARSRLGGNIQTLREEGFVVDAGPDAWVANKPDASNLAKELGLETELVGTREENRRVYIAHEGRLHAMPEGLVLGIPTEVGPLLATPLLSWEGKLRAGLDLVIPARRFDAGDDESVHAFITRRLGEEIADRLVAPLLGGIFAGDANAISVRAAFPMLVAAEEKHGSLVRAMRAAKAAGGARSRPAPSAFVTLRGGMSSLIAALRARVEGAGTVMLEQGVARIERSRPAGHDVTLAGGTTLHADELVLALPTRSAAPLVEPLYPELATALAGILDYASTIAVFLALPKSSVGHALDATGFIVPRAAGTRLVAATFVGSKWAERTPEDVALFRVFLAASPEREPNDERDDDLVELARRELGAFIPLSGPLSYAKVVRHVLASPQPKVGHLVRRDKLARLAAAIPGLWIASSGVDGVGIPDCVKKAHAIAGAILDVESRNAERRH